MSAAVAVGTGIVPAGVIVAARDTAVAALDAGEIDSVAVAARVEIAVHTDAAALENIEVADPVDAGPVATVPRLHVSVSLPAEEEVVLRRLASLYPIPRPVPRRFGRPACPGAHNSRA